MITTVLTNVFDASFSLVIGVGNPFPQHLKTQGRSRRNKQGWTGFFGGAIWNLAKLRIAMITTVLTSVLGPYYAFGVGANCGREIWTVLSPVTISDKNNPSVKYG